MCRWDQVCVTWHQKALQRRLSAVWCQPLETERKTQSHVWIWLIMRFLFRKKNPTHNLRLLTSSNIFLLFVNLYFPSLNLYIYIYIIKYNIYNSPTFLNMTFYQTVNQKHCVCVWVCEACLLYMYMMKGRCQSDTVQRPSLFVYMKEAACITHQSLQPGHLYDNPPSPWHLQPCAVTKMSPLHGLTFRPWVRSTVSSLHATNRKQFLFCPYGNVRRTQTAGVRAAQR